jgi:hypothetical protein
MCHKYPLNPENGKDTPKRLLKFTELQGPIHQNKGILEFSLEVHLDFLKRYSP